ncbi:MAG: hypothetical protein Q8P84_04645 [Deltaproteobacteria bacterium]|nr:hypothetical protein [Deltaproteobacteria bacterium]
MGDKKIIVSVCRSCIRDNAQSDAALANEECLKNTWLKKLKKGFFGKIADPSSISKCNAWESEVGCGNPSVHEQRIQAVNG